MYATANFCLHLYHMEYIFHLLSMKRCVKKENILKDEIV